MVVDYGRIDLNCHLRTLNTAVNKYCVNKTPALMNYIDYSISIAMGGKNPLKELPMYILYMGIGIK